MRLLAVIDEYTRECLAIRADQHIRSADVIETLTELMVARGVLDHIRSDNGPEFTARVIRDWLGKVGARTRCTLNQVHRGRTATWRASTESSGTSYWTGRSSTD